jgi:hypothetical protein
MAHPADARERRRVTVTLWQARRVKDRVLCGRRVPPDGPYACMGEIGIVSHDWGGTEWIRPRPGLVAEWVEGEYGPTYRNASRVRFPGRRSVVGGDPVSGFDNNRKQRGGRFGIREPFTAPCSHGGHLNRVMDDIIDTLKSSTRRSPMR